MKKTLTVNLGGTVFHIDEDAYQLLDKYLSNLRIHFRKEEGSDEIMNDFELRISELLGERIRLGYEVITIDHVEEVIKRMGKPEEIFDNENSDKEDETEEPKSRSFQESQQTEPGKKRLMRDPDNRLLGGVAAGIAAYANWDTTAVRLAMILLLCIPYTSGIFALYLVLWLVMPQAHTAADKLMMRGESVTLENIGKTVTDGFEKVSNNVNDYISSDKPRSFLQKLADLFVLVIGGILKFFAVLIGIVLIPVLLLVVFILIVVTFALIAGGTGLIFGLSPFANFEFIQDVPAYISIWGSISVILLLGIPAVALIYSICSQWFKFKPMNTSAKWILIALWFIALIGFVFYVNYVGLPGIHGGDWPWKNGLKIHQIHIS